MSTETVADLTNAALCCNQSSCPHKWENRAEVVFITNSRPLHPDLDKLICDPYLKLCNEKPMAYLDVFADDVLGLDQGPVHRRRHIQCTLFHAMYKVFKTLETHGTSD